MIWRQFLGKITAVRDNKHLAEALCSRPLDYRTACIEVSTQLFFLLRLELDYFFFIISGLNFFFADYEGSIFFITFRDLGCPSPYANSAQGPSALSEDQMSDSRWWNSFCIVKTIYHFLPFSGMQGWLPVVHWHCGRGGSGGCSRPPRSQRVLDALRCILSLIWDPFFWCAGPSGRSSIFFHGVRAQFFFYWLSGLNFFFKEFQGTIIFFNSIHALPCG